MAVSATWSAGGCGWGGGGGGWQMGRSRNGYEGRWRSERFGSVGSVRSVRFGSVGSVQVDSIRGDGDGEGASGRCGRALRVKNKERRKEGGRVCAE